LFKVSIWKEDNKFFATVASEDITLSTFRIFTSSDSATSPQSIQRSDTLYWDAQEPIIFGELKINNLLSQLPIGRDAMHEAAYFAGVELAHMIYPYWEKSERTIYTTRNSQMRRAFSFAKKEKWEEASTIWEQIANTKEGKSKAYACANLALYYELNDRFAEAIKWQERAIEAIPNAEDEYINYRNYLTILKKRAAISAEKK
jgi:tetratricopeptide (TPR) repeat protein